ncbi:unnamed protein product [Pleuronectes platessa]|uniref:Secreted protein n=1 Tax=Pleuronectes platessa TaxID=8262 RepID=A0A9N7YT99_PLEPL|nr:unnamed protein product [Pleuronectes platessa]
MVVVVLTDLAWAAASASERDPPSNHLQERDGVWEGNYEYSCRRRHVPIDADQYDQQPWKQASGRDGATGETLEVCSEAPRQFDSDNVSCCMLMSARQGKDFSTSQTSIPVYR